MNGNTVKLTNDNTNIKRSAANINYQRFFRNDQLYPRPDRENTAGNDSGITSTCSMVKTSPLLRRIGLIKFSILR